MHDFLFFEGTCGPKSVLAVTGLPVSPMAGKRKSKGGEPGSSKKAPKLELAASAAGILEWCFACNNLIRDDAFKQHWSLSSLSRPVFKTTCYKNLLTVICQD